jgi:hypothetical protein
LEAIAQSTYSTAYTITTLAGRTGIGSSDGVGGNAQLDQPSGVAVDTNGSVFFTDTANSTIRKLTSAGVVTTIAGFPNSPGSADGTNNAARFNGPSAIAVDDSGSLYVADTINFTVRKVTPAGTNWVVTTIAGLAGTPGSTDGTNDAARFGSIITWFGKAPGGGGQYFTNFAGPAGMAVDSRGNVYVGDSGNETIRKITPIRKNWVVTTLAGLAGHFGQADGTGTNASFKNVQGVAWDGSNHLYVAEGLVGNEAGYPAIRKITYNGTNWVASTVAGGGQFGSADGTGTNASFASP